MNEAYKVVLARKLAATLHLTVPERQALPNGQMPKTAIVEAVRQETGEVGWFPSECKGPNLVGEGAVIEARGGAFIVHDRREVGAMRYSEVRSQAVSTLEHAVTIYLSVVAPHAHIDGVPIDGNQ